MRFFLKLILTAFVFTTILPLINGISFHGGFPVALVLALFFGIMLWVVDFIAVALSALLTVSSFGLALLWLIPMWILGFWLLPAVALIMVSQFFPAYLTIAGWMPAIIGGLIIMLVGIVSSEITSNFGQNKAVPSG